MIGSVDPFDDSGKLRLRGTVLLENAALFLVHLEQDARHRLGVSADILDLLIGHRFRLLAEQFPTARDSPYSMGTPANSMRTSVLWSALERADVLPARCLRLSADVA